MYINDTRYKFEGRRWLKHEEACVLNKVYKEYTQITFKNHPVYQPPTKTQTRINSKPTHVAQVFKRNVNIWLITKAENTCVLSFCFNNTSFQLSRLTTKSTFQILTYFIAFQLRVNTRFTAELKPAHTQSFIKLKSTKHTEKIKFFKLIISSIKKRYFDEINHHNMFYFSFFYSYDADSCVGCSVFISSPTTNF